MKYLVAIVISVFTVFISFISLDQDIANKLGFFVVSDKDEIYVSKNISKRKKYIFAVVLAMVAFLSAIRIMEKVSDLIGVTKMLLALLCMIGAACFDYREHRIPNIFPVILAIGAVLLLGLGVIIKQAGAVAYVTTSVVAAIGCALVLFLEAVLTKQGIGAGDIKLISALALMTGVYSIIGTIFFGVVSCSIFAIVALVLKKKTTSSAVPFGPFLLLGYIITVLTTNF